MDVFTGDAMSLVVAVSVGLVLIAVLAKLVRRKRQMNLSEVRQRLGHL